MESLNRDRILLENYCPAPEEKNLGIYYPWQSPHKLEPEFADSDGGTADMIRCFDSVYSTFQWWQVKFKIV